MSDKKVCEVCGREDCWRPALRAATAHEIGECYRIGFKRERAKAAILTPEVLRLIEAGRKVRAARDRLRYRLSSPESDLADEEVLKAADALPSERPPTEPPGA